MQEMSKNFHIKDTIENHFSRWPSFESQTFIKSSGVSTLHEVKSLPYTGSLLNSNDILKEHG